VLLEYAALAAETLQLIAQSHNIPFLEPIANISQLLFEGLNVGSPRHALSLTLFHPLISRLVDQNEIQQGGLPSDRRLDSSV
jgi:hypothetical protein